MQTLLIIFIFILGASVGSFISVLNDRIKKGKKGIIFGRSACPHCKKKLKSSDLVPLISYMMLKGKCRYCHKKISSHYPALEIISALAFTALYFRFQFFNETENAYAISWPDLLQFLINIVYAVFMVAIFFFDLVNREIPDLYLFPFIAVTLIGSLIIGTPGIFSMAIALLIALLFFGGQHLVSKGKWLGSGDVYLSAGIALLLGWQAFLISVAVSYLIGGIVSIILLLTKKVSGDTRVPFAPFLILGTFVAVLFGSQLLDWYLTLITF